MAEASTSTSGSPRDQALQRALQQIEKSFGKGSIMRLDGAQSASVDGISTGVLSLDLALGGSGVPRGRTVELFGPESSGKTTLALHIVAQAQKAEGVAAFIDAEHALDPVWAKRLGVNLENLIPRAEIEGDMGDVQPGAQARLMSKAMRKLTGCISKSRCTVVFINQIREKIGVMFGNPETTPGGRALKFYSSIRIDVRRTGAIKDAERNIGSRVRARVVKNKVAPPFREAEFDIMFDGGISFEGDLLDLASSEDVAVVQKSGAWFSFGDVRLGQGRELVKGFLKDNPDLAQEIKAAVLKKKGLANGGAKPAAAAAAATTASAVAEAKEPEAAAAGKSAKAAKK